MLLSNLSNTNNIIKTYNFTKNKYFSSITSNSKLTNKNTIFIYDKNSKSRDKYIIEAIRNKSPAIISNKYLNYVTIPQFIVKDISLETELLLKSIYKKLPYKTIAVTGTNGKTSVVWYISKILSLLNYNNISVGTLGHFRNGKKISDVSLTTPAYEELYKYGNSLQNSHHIYIFEASSHALEQNRLRKYPVDIAAITNISSDHLDYHKNLSEYKKAKIKLFTKHLSNKGHAIINSRIKNILTLKRNLKNKKININYFGKKSIVFKKKQNFITFIVNKKIYKINELRLNTDIELENLECAIACCLALKINQKKIIPILKKITNPPGRLQTIKYKKKKI